MKLVTNTQMTLDGWYRKMVRGMRTAIVEQAH
jgi:hypothetical protein